MNSIQFVLETERLRLRELTVKDVGNLQGIFSDPEAMRYYPSTFDVERTQQWIQWNRESYQANGYGLWALEDKHTSEFLGECGITIQNVEGAPEDEIGYHVLRTHWNKGYASEAAQACRDHAFTKLGKDRLISWMIPDNLPSRRVAEKIGMSLEKEVVNNRGTASVVYAIHKADWLQFKG